MRPDAGNAIRDRNARKTFAGIEGRLPDTGDGIRDVVVAPYLACRISMQHRLLCIEQNPIDNRVIHVPHTNLNCRQAGAPREGSIPDAGDTIRNIDARQAAATLEGIILDAGNTVRDRDSCKALATMKGLIPDASDAVGDRDTRQVGAEAESKLPDVGDGFTLNDRRYGCLLYTSPSPRD